MEYIPPSKQSLEALLDYGKDPGVEHKGKVKILLIDEEVNVSPSFIPIDQHQQRENSVMITTWW